MKFKYLFAIGILAELTTSEFVRHDDHDSVRGLRPKASPGKQKKNPGKQKKNPGKQKKNKDDMQQPVAIMQQPVAKSPNTGVSQFIQNAVLRETVRSEGMEVQGMHEVRYNVTYLKAGYVSLANAYSNIENVMCEPGKINVRFYHPVEVEDLPLMFPKGSLLVVDGAFFHINCTVGDTPTLDTLPTSGFLIIDGSELAHQDGRSVAVIGFAAHFNMLFQEKNISYHALSSPTIRRLEVVEDQRSVTLPPNPEGWKVVLNSKTTATANIAQVVDYWRLTSDSWWTFDPYIDFMFQFSYKLELEVGAMFEMEDETDLFSFEKEYNMIAFPVVGFRLPGDVSNVLLKVLPATLLLKPALGLGVEAPALLKGEAKLNSKLSIEAKTSFSSGEKSFNFGVKGRPPGGLQTFFNMEKDEPFTQSGDITPVGDMVTSELEIDFFAGLKPQVKIDGIGLAEATVGLYAGIQLRGQIDLIQTLPPVEKASDLFPKMIGCDDCHRAELDGSFVAREPFFSWKHFLDKETNEEPLAKLNLTFALLKMCIIDDPTVRSCIDKCCDIDSECTPSADGMSGTCGQCVASDGGCCQDSDCGGLGLKCISRECSQICIPDIPPGNWCTNEDCEGENPLCGGPDGHTCILCGFDTGECCNDYDCGDLDIFICQDRYCMEKICDKIKEGVGDGYGGVEKCCEDSDCTRREGTTCQSRICVLPGSPRFTLRWYGQDDLDLHVQPPNGAHIYFGMERDLDSGGFLDVDMVPFEVSRNVENIQFPMDGTAPVGMYYFWVDVYNQYDDEDPWTVSVFLDKEGDPSFTPVVSYSGTNESALFQYEK